MSEPTPTTQYPIVTFSKVGRLKLSNCVEVSVTQMSDGSICMDTEDSTGGISSLSLSRADYKALVEMLCMML